MSIIEVLFAILITTVGLFGAIAVFPFASAQARRSRIYDMVAVAGRSAIRDFDARGMRNPNMWVAWDELRPPALGGPSFQPLANVVTPPQPVPVPGNPSGLPVISPSYCLDPRGIAAQMSPGPALLPFNACIQNFPYARPGTARVQPGRMRRITLRPTTNPLLMSFNSPMSLLQADSIFKIDDDISYDRSDDDKSAPASQSVTGIDPTLPVTSTNSWSRRAIDGNVSWMATLVPKFDVSGLSSDEYVLSIVMFFERPNDLGSMTDGTGVVSQRERVVEGDWQDPSAATGGEIKLTWPVTGPEVKLRPNDWVMISGSRVIPDLNGVVTQHRWYRIADCDSDPAEEIDLNGTATGNYEFYATLMGQDWNTGFVSHTATRPMQVDVTLVQGAFAVYEKTIRLDETSSF